LGSLDELIQRGARQFIQQTIEAELATLLEPYDNVNAPAGKRTVVRNDHLPRREIVTAIEPLLKARIRSGSGSALDSNILSSHIPVIHGLDETWLGLK